MTVRIVFLLLFSFVVARADRGMLPVSRSDISVYGPGQKAIIAWNGKTEVIILSTDIYASAETKVLGVLPLPSLPKVMKGDFKSFASVQQLISSHLPRPKVLAKEGGRRELVPTPGVQVLFQEKIGAHDLTAVKANDFEEFVRWAQDFVKKSETGASALEFSLAWQEMVRKYLDTGYRYFVFDIVTLGSEKKSLEPIVYEFSSKAFYYPLAISSLLPGNTEIQLFAITPEIPDIWALELPIDFGSYYTFHGQRKNIIFQIGVDEVKRIAPELRGLFSKSPYFSCLKYEGPLADLESDIVLSDFLKPVKR